MGRVVRRVSIEPSFASWRLAARTLLAEDVSPEHVVWDDGGPQVSLFGAPAEDTRAAAGPSPAAPAARLPEAGLRVPRALIELAEVASHHRDPSRWDVLYRVLHRTARGAHDLVDDPLDPDVARLRVMAGDVRREEHRMHAYVRFRRVEHDGAPHFIAWYAPDHPILALVAPFFRRRFAAMRWTILTPDASVTWDGAALVWGPGVTRREGAGEDAFEDLFRTYYAATFNPARTRVEAMRRHMPAHRWRDLPELRDLGALVARAPSRTTSMTSPAPLASASTALAAPAPDLDALAAALRTCTACPLHARATQVVPGRGPGRAPLLLVGEQPGDEEDQAGAPFVGPAGRLLDEALAEVGIPRDAVHVTNAVKHFKWVPAPRGKRRLHSRASPAEIQACRGWLDAEIRLVQPAMILCLGATAARAFLGPRFSLRRDRGRVFPTPWAPWWMATWHPAAILRGEDAAAALRDELIGDLRAAARALHALHPESDPPTPGRTG